MVYIPDDSDFSSFREQCESAEGWHCHYNKAGVTVWSQGQEESCTVQKIKVSPPLLQPPSSGARWGSAPDALLHAGKVLGSFPACPTSQHCQQGAAAAWKTHPGHLCVLALPLPLLCTQVGIIWWRWPCWESRGHGVGWCISSRYTVLGYHCLTSQSAEHPWGSQMPHLSCFVRGFAACQGMDLGCCGGTSDAHPSLGLSNLIAHPHGTSDSAG